MNTHIYKLRHIGHQPMLLGKEVLETVYCFLKIKETIFIAQIFFQQRPNEQTDNMIYNSDFAVIRHFAVINSHI